MNRWLNNASSDLKKSRLAGACRILPCIFGADIGAQLGHNLNQFVTSAIGAVTASCAGGGGSGTDSVASTAGGAAKGGGDGATATGAFSSTSGWAKY